MNDRVRFALDVLGGFGDGLQAVVIEHYIVEQERLIAALAASLEAAIDDRAGWPAIARLALDQARSR